MLKFTGSEDFMESLAEIIISQNDICDVIVIKIQIRNDSDTVV